MFFFCCPPPPPLVPNPSLALEKKNTGDLGIDWPTWIIVTCYFLTVVVVALIWGREQYKIGLWYVFVIVGVVWLALVVNLLAVIKKK